MVRSLHYVNFRAPWPFVKKGQKGWRKVGPVVQEKIVWPSPDKEFPELNPKLYGHDKNPPQLHSEFLVSNSYSLCFSDYTNVKAVGYTDPETKKFVMVKEMVPELIVPDLSTFVLKPYVSYKVDVEIEKRSFLPLYTCPVTFFILDDLHTKCLSKREEVKS